MEISGAFQKYYMFGFTGTPIFSVNASTASKSMLFTTRQTFGDQLHEYTIVDAINDKNVLPFRVDYIKTMDADRDEWKRKRENGESTDIIDDIVFEVELIKQIEINIDYILILVKKYHDTHCEDKEVLVTIKKAIDASPELRSKKQLIETFIAGINDMDDVMTEWHDYVAEQRENDLVTIIKEEKLKEEETRRFLENSFREGEVKTVGTDIEKLLPPVSRFGGGNRAKKKQGVIEKLKNFFEKYFGVGGSISFTRTDADESDN